MGIKVDEFGAAVAASVRAEVARAGLQQSALVPVLGLSRNTTYSRLRGDSAFTSDELARAAAFLGVDIAVFFQRPTAGAA